MARPQLTSGKRIAIMQPYFFPYAGYFRLLSGVDEFVLMDSVQFIRRGRIHRTQLPNLNGVVEWLTLPLKSHPVETPITAIEFADGARQIFDRRLERFPRIARPQSQAQAALRDCLFGPLDGFVDYLETSLRLAAELMGIDVPPIVRSSSIALEAGLRGEDRIIAIARQRDATHYLNAPGGRGLYDPERFRSAGLHLEFLPPYDGPYVYLLADLFECDPRTIGATLAAESSYAG